VGEGREVGGWEVNIGTHTETFLPIQIAILRKLSAQQDAQQPDVQSPDD
jgi:hypothetical protein